MVRIRVGRGWVLRSSLILLKAFWREYRCIFRVWRRRYSTRKSADKFQI